MTAMLEQVLRPDVLASGLLALLLGWICVVDLRHFRIPDAASLGLITTGLAFSLMSPVVTPVWAVTGSVIGYAAFAGLGAAYFRVAGQDGLGLGDAKLLAAAGAWLGLRDLPMLVAMAAVGALTFALLSRQRKLAFGPWLAGAFWIIWVTRISA